MSMNKLSAAWLMALGICVLAHLPALGASSAPGQVAHCFDGDTVKLSDRRVVRLAGIDAPETSRQGQPGQYYSREAKRLLASLAQGQKVDIAPRGEQTKDRYGRVVGEIILPDGSSLNERMVEEGAAFFYPHEGLDPDFERRLMELQAQAISGRRGMWARLLESPEAQANFVGNRNSRRFFPVSCLEALKIRPRNREYFGNLMDAFLAGYAPARVCPFWPRENRVRSQTGPGI